MTSEIWAALADDAATLARLHDREPDAATLAALREVGFPDNLALLPPDDAAREAWAAMRAALATVSPAPTFSELDTLAADYAAIYLTGACNVSPCESFWLDEDHLHCQQPMWALREVYAAAGLAAPDWRKRPDDHLVLQLHYIAHMLHRIASTDNAPAEAGDSILPQPDLLDVERQHFSPGALGVMLDAHLLRWLPDFTTRIAAHAGPSFHAALARLTLAWCNALRSLLENES